MIDVLILVYSIIENIDIEVCGINLVCVLWLCWGYYLVLEVLRLLFLSFAFLLSKDHEFCERSM